MANRTNKLVDISVDAWDMFHSPEVEKQEGALPVDITNTYYSAAHTKPYGATYSIKYLKTNEVIQRGTWYKFDRAPMFCPGPSRGSACPFSELKVNATSDTEYFQKYLSCSTTITDTTASGGPNMGIYPLFDAGGICNGKDYGYNERLLRPAISPRNPPLIVTNEWGTDTGFYDNRFSGLHTSWDTSHGDGRYQIDVVVCDIEGDGGSGICSDTSGHSAGRSLIVRVNNDPGDDDTNDPSFKDIFIRDSDADVGAVPSNVGGQPYWESPDILVVNQGDGANPDKRVNKLIEGHAYHVWVQAHYGLCNTISGIKVAVASAAQAAFNAPGDWKWITQPNSTFVGPPGSPDGVGMTPGTDALWIGPFAWTPTSEEVGDDGHRCLLAALTSAQDTTSVDDMTMVKDRNNVAQRNIQIGNAMMACVISNPFVDEASIALRFSSPDMIKPYTMSLDYDAALESAWTGTRDVSLAHVGSHLVATFKANDVSLPAVTLPGYAKKPFSLTADGYIGQTVTIRTTENADQVDVGGTTMSYTVPDNPR